ncbi:MAG TPA: hypothetical protein VGD56_22250, partial [Gemmatirosa sp.]
MTSNTRSSRRAAFTAAVATLLCAAPVVLAAQTPDQQPPAGQPPAGGPGRGGMGARGMSMLMQGITLSDAQRTQLDSVQAAG